MRKISTARLIVATVSVLSFGVVVQGQTRAELLAQLETKRAEIRIVEKQFLAPSDDDRATFSEFLKQPDRGLIRLLPREDFDGFRDKPSPLTIRGGGAYYSFVRLTHEYGYGSDIELSRGELSVGFAGFDYGAIALIGDVPLEEVTSELPAAAFLINYTPPSSEPAAREEGRSFWPGKALDGLTYSRRLPVKVNGTYLLRSISYENSDVLVALRVVRKDTDGSLIIAWKMLEKFPTPKVARNE